MADEKRYLDLLSIRSPEDAYAQVRELASELTNDQHLIRSCIFDLHAAVEVELRKVFYHTFKVQLFLTDDEKQNEKTTARFDKMVRGLGFGQMYRILSPLLDSWPYPDLQSIKDINDARNSAAHNETDRIAYKGRNPFNDADCLAQMYLDVWAIKQSMAKYFDRVIEGPRAQLKRYIDKYGPGEL